jgi:BspA type Leucine rich repeat region (6 copies)/Secretion system C-terminal sorting domain
MKQKLLLFLAFLSLSFAMAQELFKINTLYYQSTGANTVKVFSADDNIIGDLIIPEQVSYKGLNYTVNQIESYAFNEKKNMTSVILPSTITSIGNGAFSRCFGLKSVNLPNGLTSIGNLTFSDCTSLNSINLPNSLTSIGNETFSYCTSLTSINLPNNLNTIGNDTFSRSGLNSITLPNSLTSIGVNTFGSCTSLTSVTLPNNLSSVGNRVFSYCTSLNSINLPDSLRSIGDYTFGNCISLTNIKLPITLTSIGNGTFSITGLTSLIIPSSVISIGKATFYSNNVASLEIPEGVISLGEHSFAEQYSVKSLKLPSTLTTIGLEAFGSDTELKLITCNIKSPIYINEDTFKKLNRPGCVLCVPAGSVEAYKAAPIWKDFQVQACNEEMEQLSTKDILFDAQTTLGPNPSHNVINIHLAKAEKAHLTVLDAQACVVLEQNLLAVDNTVDVSVLPKGIYWCKLSAGKESKVYKIIKY